ncbi:MAG TPA: TRIC cation channel family protein [Candidatus Dormibacteraeota bacterium]|nr:TRIC cation channel family protein [Candidatus Dormibacteraeota bacterium]
MAASTNAFNGALLCRRPTHYRNYTVVGVILMALLGGIGGGVSRDVILNKIPSAFTNPLYILLCVVAAYLALQIHYRAGQEFREGLFQFMTAFSLPWYAVVGCDAALRAGLPALPAIVIGVIGPTAGRYFIDITSGVTPKHFVKGEWFVGTAVLTSIVYVVCYWSGLSIVPASLISFGVGFAFRLMALFKGWEEPEPMDQPKPPEPPRKTLGTAIKEEIQETKKESS